MVLLDVARKLPDVRLIVAHINHGIRSDSSEDAALVRQTAMSHNLEYVETKLHLGEGASEEIARQARYDFLRHMREKYNATAILTAHHRDDLIETAVINMLRGTGWRGLSSLRSTGDVLRPLLAVTKAELEEYASRHSLSWRYDRTNSDLRYTRNRVRHTLLPAFRPEQRQKLYEYIVRQNRLTDTIDRGVAEWIDRYCTVHESGVALPRYDMTMMSDDVAHEIIQSILRHQSGKSIPRPLVARALLFVKVAKPGKIFPINATWRLRALPREVIVERTPLVVS